MVFHSSQRLNRGKLGSAWTGRSWAGSTRQAASHAPEASEMPTGRGRSTRCQVAIGLPPSYAARPSIVGLTKAMPAAAYIKPCASALRERRRVPEQSGGALDQSLPLARYFLAQVS